ncbi:autotransporter domain-containing protein [Pleomorphomonas sp. NRK KF1]|uniref:autotransporter outer membrane beta-barrel domain-containing protein n=1 Tax=Pleomorphomonas sp. NRK KF1 TaxID=2943000 RepID=UPI002044C639|nr:autotransporter domain-containing protein [Pleomorphomonas sp. NRK KF1]MCM5555293.1 autotransporter domain-containing protein [Pleomorphomonas sp. NRK KF1]
MASTALVLVTTPAALAETNWTGNLNNEFNVYENWDSNFNGGDLVIDGAHNVTTSSATIATDINSVNAPGYGPRSLVISGGATLTSTITGYAAIAVGWTSGVTSTMTVTGAGSKLVVEGTDGSWTNVGFKDGATGILTVSNGGTFETNYHVAVGQGAGSTGTIEVDNGTLNVLNSGQLIIGNGDNSTGTVNIANGSTANLTGHVFVGNADGVTANLNITSGSNVTVGGQIVAGAYAATGDITVSGGSSLTVEDAVVLAYAGGSSSTLTVTGSGTTATLKNGLYVGYGNLGKTVVSEGASVTVSGELVVAYDTGSAGELIVTGAGSTLKANGTVYVGNMGPGSLTVSNGGALNAGTVEVAAVSGATGTVVVGAAEGQTATSAGKLNIDTLAFGAGTGKLVFNHTDSAYTFSSAVTGAGTIKSLSGVTSLTGDYSAYTGAVTVDGGLLSVDTSSFTQNAFTVNDGGALRVTGAVSNATDTVTLNGGSLINTGSIDGNRFGIELSSGYTSAITTSGSIDGDLAAIHYSAGGNRLTILSGASFGNVVDYSLTTGNTTSFGDGSFSIPVAYYLEGGNTVTLSNTRQTVLYSNAAGSSGKINVVDTGTTASQFTSVQTITSSVATVTADVLSVDVDRSISSRIALAYDDVEQKSESQKAISTMVGDGLAVDPRGNLFWMRAFGGVSHDDYSDTSAHNFGVAFGVDHMFDKTRVGVMGGLGKLTNHSGDNTATTSGDTVFAGVYLRQPLSSFTLDASVIAGGMFADTTREVNSGTETARGSYDGWFVSPEIALSRAYALSGGWTLTPRGSVRYTYGSFQGYTETGSTMNLSYDDRSTQAVEGAFELKISKAHRLESGKVATLSVTAAALDTYNLGDADLNASLSGTDLTVSTMGDRNQFGGRVGLGAELKLDANATLFGGVSATGYTDDSWSVTGNAGLKVQF